MRSKLFLLLALIVLLAIIIRIESLRFNALMEPDEYYHLRTAEYIIQSGKIIPQTLNFSGYPVHSIVLEPITFYWLIISVSRIANVSLFDVFLYLPVILGVLYVILSGLLAREIRNNNLFILLTMLLVATSGANLVRTTAGELRGDTLAPLFLILSVLIASRILSKDSHRLILALVLGVTISLSYLVWRGSIFIPAVFLLFEGTFIIVSYLRGDGKALLNSLYVLLGLAVFSILAKMYYAYGLITVTNPLLSNLYAPLFVVVFAVAVFCFALELRKRDFGKRLIYSVSFALASIIVALLAYHFFGNVPQKFDSISILNNRIFQTVAELQPTSLGTADLLGFGLLSPVGLVFMAGTGFGKYGIVFLIPLAIVSIVYLFMGFRRDRAVIGLEPRPIWLLVLSYLVVAAGLAFLGLRFVYLLSIPLSLTAAYTLFWTYEYSRNDRRVRGFVLAIIVMVAVFSPVVGLLSGYFTLPADNLNPGLFNSLYWLRNNTAQNSVVLTSWWDGSLVEGISNRTSVTDSVGAQDTNAVYLFSDWLYANYTNASIFQEMGRPNYLLVRRSWFGQYDAFGYPIYKDYQFSNETNFYALLYRCGGVCQVDSNSIRFNLVHSDNDSSIYAINYT